MSFSKRFLKKMVSTVFVFNSFLFMGSDFIFQSSVSAHTVTIKEDFKDLIRQINLNGGYTGTGMPFGFSDGEECVYIPCGNGNNIIVPKRVTECISYEFNMYFHDLVLKYSLRPKTCASYPYSTPGPYPTQEQVMTPTPYPTQEQVMAPAPYPIQEQVMAPAPLSYIPASTDTL